MSFIIPKHTWVRLVLTDDFVRLEAAEPALFVKQGYICGEPVQGCKI